MRNLGRASILKVSYLFMISSNQRFWTVSWHFSWNKEQETKNIVWQLKADNDTSKFGSYLNYESLYHGVYTGTSKITENWTL